ncbi:hypothetical protein F0562_001743 [Nyssa sinensis]|uniref:Uncharacterized protein n=1 Tax=Nyssa sinensis TaxID=561372 RepID=A0A5J5C4I2_9ASTE|nr:hypothetical protein F0562_001743 [Nyssa sinensis]
MEVRMALNRVIYAVVVLRITACRVFNTERLFGFRTPLGLLLTSSDGFGISNGRWDDRQWRGVEGPLIRQGSGRWRWSFALMNGCGDGVAATAGPLQSPE